MRTKRKAESVFGAILLCAGVVILIGVLLTILVPSELPGEFRLHDGSDNEERGASPPLLVAQGQGADAGPTPIQLGNNSEKKTGEVDNAGVLRYLPADNSRIAELMPKNLPGYKQNELLVAAIGQFSTEPVESITSTPNRISIPTLGVEAPIRAVGLSAREEDEEQFLQWAVPNEYAVGWHQTSAPLGTTGNTVLNGHNNIHGAVFRDLVDLQLGERLILSDDSGSYEYKVTGRELFEEDGQSLKERHWNARWMLPTSDERLTIITCWPNSTNSHRLVVVAQPIDKIGT